MRKAVTYTVGVALSLSLVLLAKSFAFGQVVETIALGPDLSARASAFRDQSDRTRIYFVPIVADIARTDGDKPRVGVQLFRSDTDPNLWKASVTLSLVLKVLPADLEAVRSVASTNSPPTIYPNPAVFSARSIIRVPGAKDLAVTTLQQGNLSLGANVAVAFEVTGSAAGIKSLLMGTDGDLGIVIDFALPIRIAFVNEATISGVELANKFGEQGLLSTDEARRLPSVISFIVSRFKTAGSAEIATARQWLLEKLGNPTIWRKQDGMLVQGWNLASADLSQVLTAQTTVTLRALTASAGPEHFAAIYRFADWCNLYKANIVNLEDTSVGCEGLK